MTKKVGQRDGAANERFDPADFGVLRSTISTLAPGMVEPAGEAPHRADRYDRSTEGAKAPHEEQASPASSVRPRERRGSGVPAHELRAKVEQAAELATDPLRFETQAELQDLLSREVEDEGHECRRLSEGEEVDRRIQDSLLEDAILDAYRDNMEALAQANETRDFARGEDLWHERYRFDARNRLDGDEAGERARNAEADRRAADERRRADEEAARRRLDDDRNRR